MRPYLAVLHDSFREALASRVLVVLLGLIVLFLAALALLSVREERPRKLSRSEILDEAKFLRTLAKAESDDVPAAAAVLGRELPDSLQDRIAEFRRHGGDRRTRRQLLGDVVDAINRLLERPHLFPPELWQGEVDADEARELAAIPSEQRTPAQNARLNRLLLRELLPDSIGPPPPSTLALYWAGWRWTDSLPFPPNRLQKVVESTLALITNALAGTIGVFVAILVTSSIIPQTFEPGAIDLLLSKPVSRSLLFLTKFFGGCAFTLLNAGLLISGLWLIAGLRFDVWNHRLFLCLPVFLFLFAIYYSVSALAGVIWRNAIVSVGIAILFWLACFVVGTTKTTIETFFLNSRRLAVIVPAGKTLIVTNRAGEAYRWNTSSQLWEQVFHSTGGNSVPFGLSYPLIGPQYDPVHDRLVAITRSRQRFGDEMRILAGPRDEDWKRVQGVAAPAGTQAMLLTPEGNLLVVTRDGLLQYTGDPTVEHTPVKFFGFDLLPQSKTDEFKNIGPESPGWHGNLAAAISPDGSRIAVVHGNRIQVLESRPDDNETPGASDLRYQVIANVELDVRRAAILALSRTDLIAAFEDGRIRVYDAASLVELRSFEPSPGIAPRSAAVSPDGRWFAVVMHDGHLWLYDGRRGEPIETYLSGKGDITAVAFSPEGAMFVAEGFGRVSQYRLDPLVLEHDYAPPADTLELAYRFVILPIYTLFPKPGELDSVVSYLLTGEKTVPIGSDESPLESEHMVIDVWRPIASNLAFLTVMLLVSCVYIARRDF